MWAASSSRTPASRAPGRAHFPGRLAAHKALGVGWAVYSPDDRRAAREPLASRPRDQLHPVPEGCRREGQVSTLRSTRCRTHAGRWTSNLLSAWERGRTAAGSQVR
ncbi:hypothetical protein GCM10009741_25540 [Kribbella lupini]|uniref:Uncharacterized protein n=1 Tax=Kribbella lupini TaxID=291602 RepID=A0ABN2APC8_9ACTN